MKAPLLSLVVVAASIAGCADEAPSPEFHATASKPFFSVGWAHAGPVEAGEGTATVDVDEATNQGQVTASFDAGGRRWVVQWTAFAEAPGRAFQSGGIARDLREHGDTGVGDTQIPAVHLVSAGWGEARVTVDGQPFPDPFGPALWSAHYMATDTGARAADGRIKTRAGGVYDPSRPAEGATEDGDRELWLVLRPSGTAPEDFNFTAEEPVQGVAYEKSFPFRVADPGGRLRVDFSAAPAAGVPDAVPLSDLTFSLVDAAGTVVQSAKNKGTFDTAAPPGEYTVKVEGTGFTVTYDISIAVAYPPSDPYVVVFEDATW